MEVKNIAGDGHHPGAFSSLLLSPWGGRDALHGTQGSLGARPTYFPIPMLSLCIPATSVPFYTLVSFF